MYMCTIPTATELHQCLPGVQYYMYCIHTSVSMHVSTNMCKYVCIYIYIQRTRCYRTSPTPTWCVKLHIHVYVCVHIFVYMYICMYMFTIPTATELHQCLPGVQYYMYCIHKSVSVHVSTNMCKYVCIYIYIQRTRCYRTSPMPTWCAILRGHVHVCIHICVYMYMCIYKFIKPTAIEPHQCLPCLQYDICMYTYV